MTEIKPKLLVAECSGFADSALHLLRKVFSVQLADLSRAELISQLSDVDYLWVRLRSMIDEQVISVADQLKAIVTNTTGLNHIDLRVAERRNIAVLSLRGEVDFLNSIRATAEHTLALTLAVLRKIPAAHSHVIHGGWDRSLFCGSEIHEKRVGIIGFGRLGKIVAKYFEAFGAKIVLCSHGLDSGTTVGSFEVLTLEELLQTSDIVSLHADYQPANAQMLRAEHFAMMRPNAIFINTARGELVDQSALLDALQRGVIGGAGIDVLEDEQGIQTVPERIQHVARSLERFVVTPHIGGNTCESLEKTEVFMAQKLCEFHLARVSSK